jgi:hypothetical protein
MQQGLRLAALWSTRRPHGVGLWRWSVAPAPGAQLAQEGASVRPASVIVAYRRGGGACACRPP